MHACAVVDRSTSGLFVLMAKALQETIAPRVSRGAGSSPQPPYAKGRRRGAVVLLPVIGRVRASGRRLEDCVEPEVQRG